MKIIAGIVGGFFVAFIGLMVVSITLGASAGKGLVAQTSVFISLWIAAMVVAALAPSAAKAWRRLFLSSAVLSFLLPLAGVIFTGSTMATHIDPAGQYAGAAMAGTAIGGGLVAGFLGFVGFFMGLIFLVIGLLVGRDKQIIYMQAPSAPAPGTPAPHVE